MTLAGGELGTSYFLPRIIGRGRAAAHLLTGKEISTQQAEQWGLLNEAWIQWIWVCLNMEYTSRNQTWLAGKWTK